ncbi:hypothetical protein [Apilactobacillus timberlakei]|uniref:hypothetical protein n=1 Tax=Apilactobacillus timberlakei TaxID=2008380 RepID=UPI00112E8B49|nr:hypothetical protein [Apilactobacillus timberlakei]TPR16759.1 hypothetical protein DYZ95_07195 [Apilactobacillus timberlakei]TPR21522.1 hypothetical protein DY083_05745 [Apilactobacillus timberlakei]
MENNIKSIKITTKYELTKSIIKSALFLVIVAIMIATWALEKMDLISDDLQLVFCLIFITVVTFLLDIISGKLSRKKLKNSSYIDTSNNMTFDYLYNPQSKYFIKKYIHSKISNILQCILFVFFIVFIITGILMNYSSTILGSSILIYIFIAYFFITIKNYLALKKFNKSTPVDQLK